MVPFLGYFQKTQLFVVKKIWNNFAALYFYLYELKKSVSDYTLEISIILSFVVNFFRDMFNWKAPFLPEKISEVEYETHFRREAVED